MSKNGLSILLCLLIVTTTGLCFVGPHSDANAFEYNSGQDHLEHEQSHSKAPSHPHNQTNHGFSCCVDFQTAFLDQKQNESLTLPDLDYLERFFHSDDSQPLIVTKRVKRCLGDHGKKTLVFSRTPSFLRSDPINAPPLG